MMFDRDVSGAGVAASLLMGLMLLGGCDTIGNPLEAIGARIPPPDEFQVIARAPLAMPANASLPEPRPGAPSPLDSDPHRDAIEALMGVSGSAAMTTSQPNIGEQVLLSSANAAAASSDIRVQLETDKTTLGKDKSYQIPTLSELLGGGSGKDKLDEATLLDPVAESQRLQRDGLMAPSDPEAVADVAEGERPAPVGPTYPTGRPASPITAAGATPKF